MRTPIRGRVRWVALVTFVGALAVGGVAYAVIPDSSGIIHACYKKSGGALRVIDSSARSCDANESPLTWKQAGAESPDVVAHARVDDDGSVLPGEIGVIAVEHPSIGSGVYFVHFDVSVSDCTPMASLWGGFSSNTSVFVTPAGVLSFQVLTTGNGTLSDRPFNIAVFC